MCVDKKLDSLIRVSFYALIFFLPISIALVGIFAAFAILFFLIKRILIVCRSNVRGFKAIIDVLKPAKMFLSVPLGAYVFAVVVSVVLSHYHHLSILSFFGKILRGVFLYASFVEAFTDIRFINNFILIWFSSAFVTGLSGLSQYFGGIDFLRHTTLSGGRVSSCLRQANDLGAYIVAVCLPLFVVLLNWKTFFKEFEIQERFKAFGRIIFLKAFLVIACLVLMACLGLTLSRGSWIAFFAALIVCGIYKKKNLLISFLVIMGFIVLFTPVMIKARNVSLITDDVLNQSIAMKQTAHEHGFFSTQYIQMTIDYTVKQIGMGRSGFWQEALGIIYDHPLFGSGLNTYSVVAPAYRINWGGYPHNSYLQMTAELGLFGIGMFLWMLFVLFNNSFGFLRFSSNKYQNCLLLGVMVGLFAFLIQSFFDTTFYSVQLSVLMWLMIAVAVSIQRLTKVQG